MAVGTDTSAAGAALNNLVERQSWYQERANLVTTVVGFLATVAAWAATQPFATEPWVQTFILVVGFLATAAGVSVTPNGFTKSQMKKINREQADLIGSTSLVSTEYLEPEQEPEDQSPSLESQVEEYNRERFGR